MFSDVFFDFFVQFHDSPVVKTKTHSSGLYFFLCWVGPIAQLPDNTKKIREPYTTSQTFHVRYRSRRLFANSFFPALSYSHISLMKLLRQFFWKDRVQTRAQINKYIYTHTQNPKRKKKYIKHNNKFGQIKSD